MPKGNHSQLVPEWPPHYDSKATSYLLLIFSPSVVPVNDPNGRQESTDQVCPSAVD